MTKKRRGPGSIGARAEWKRPEIRMMSAGGAEGAPAMAVENTSGKS